MVHKMTITVDLDDVFNKFLEVANANEGSLEDSAGRSLQTLDDAIDYLQGLGGMDEVVNLLNEVLDVMTEVESTWIDPNEG